MKSRIQLSQKLPEPCFKGHALLALNYKPVHETEQLGCLFLGLHQHRPPPPPCWLQNHVGIFWGEHGPGSMGSPGKWGPSSCGLIDGLPEPQFPHL